MQDILAHLTLMERALFIIELTGFEKFKKKAFFMKATKGQVTVRRNPDSDTNHIFTFTRWYEPGEFVRVARPVYSNSDKDRIGMVCCRSLNGTERDPDLVYLNFYDMDHQTVGQGPFFMHELTPATYQEAGVKIQ